MNPLLRHRNPESQPNNDNAMSDVGPWPSAGDTDEFGEREPQPIGVRNERDVCSVCGIDYGGTVGDRSKMTINYLVCRRCTSARKKEVA